MLKVKYFVYLKYLIFFFILSVILNCFPAKKITPPEKITPENALKKANASEKNLKTFAGRLNIKVRKNKKGFSTNIELLHKKPDKFAIYFKSSLGINLLKVVFRNDSLLYFRSDEGRFYSDSYDNFLKTKTWEWDIDLKTLLYFIVGKTGLADPKISFLSSEKRYFVYILEDDEWIKKFWIDKKKFFLKKSYWIKKEKDESFLIKYEKYKRFDGFNYPKEIKINSSSGERVKIKFRKIKVNLDLEEKRFKIDIPSNLEN